MNTYNSNYEPTRWCPSCEVGWAFQDSGEECWCCGRTESRTSKPVNFRHRHEPMPGRP